MSKTNEVAVKKENSVAVFDESAFEAFAGAGSENVDLSSLRIPMLKIAEPLSDQLKKSNSKYIEGCKAGDIVDTSINEVIGTELEFIPVAMEVTYIEWENKKPKEVYSDKSILAKCEWRDTEGQKKGWFLPNGNEVAETHTFYGINITSGGVWSVIPMSRGRLPAAGEFTQKLLRTLLPSGKKAPFFYHVWDVKVKDATSKGGDDFKTWGTSRSMKLTDREDGAYWYEEAVKFYKKVGEGKVVADFESGVDSESHGQRDVPF